LSVVPKADAVALRGDIAEIVKQAISAPGETGCAHEKKISGLPRDLPHVGAGALTAGKNRPSPHSKTNPTRPAVIAYMIAVRSDAKRAGRIALYH
jgi:hypothetical protein